MAFEWYTRRCPPTHVLGLRVRTTAESDLVPHAAIQEDPTTGRWLSASSLYSIAFSAAEIPNWNID